MIILPVVFLIVMILAFLPMAVCTVALLKVAS